MSLDRKDLRDQEDQLVVEELKENKDLLEQLLVFNILVHSIASVPHRVKLVKMARKEDKAQPDPLDKLVHLDLKDPKARKENL